MKIRFDDQIVLITGAARGLGAAYARLIAKRGGRVIVHDGGVGRDGHGGDPEPARKMAADIRTNGGDASAEVQNLATKEGCKALIDSVMMAYGRIDALIHSAGIVRYKQIAETTDDEWETQRKINIDAPFWLCRAIWPHMKEQEYGRIVLTVSGYGLNAYEGNDVTAYGVGKAAQFGLMNGLAGEGMGHNILVNAISPVAATRIFRAKVGPDEFSPDSVAPGVAVLASRACPWTGRVLTAAGGKFRVARLHNEHEFELETYPSPEDLLKKMAVL